MGMQFVPTSGVSKTPITEPHPAQVINPRVGRILERSCQDCHSNRTTWPWYSHVAPVSWVISRHVIEGREILNFSEWSTQPPSEGDRLLICDAVSDGRMPLAGYTAIHRGAKLSKEDVKVICEWADAPNTPTAPTYFKPTTNSDSGWQIELKTDHAGGWSGCDFSSQLLLQYSYSNIDLHGPGLPDIRAILADRAVRRELSDSRNIED